MARIRSIHPGFFTDEDLCEKPFWIRLLFIGLWCHANFEGRLKDKPAGLKKKLFPDQKVDIEEGLRELAKPKIFSTKHAPFIYRYEVDREKYIQILNWSGENGYQHPHRTEDKPHLPDPPKNMDFPNTTPEGASEAESEKPKFEAVDMELAVFMADEIRKHNEKFIRPDKETLEKWADEFRLMRTINRYEPRDTRKLIVWCQADEFERNNVMSPGKLRKRFAQLWGKMNQKKAGEKTQEELDREDEEALKDPGR